MVHNVLKGPVTQWRSAISQNTWFFSIFPIVENVAGTPSLETRPCSYENSTACVLLLVIFVHNLVICICSMFKYIYKTSYLKFCSLLCSVCKYWNFWIITCVAIMLVYHLLLWSIFHFVGNFQEHVWTLFVLIASLEWIWGQRDKILHMLYLCTR
jgi:hypothetical protein